ncbi:hypothetical protein B0H19DRAFT_1268241 [Mycena capillaripes]|nr:hypothetical protein B0H19DRAFT_1268241 [Mycena capillaripes]
MNLKTSEGTSESILARSKWVIPLSGGAPLHWILAWVDYATKDIGIFDSIPELGSSSWAEPLLLLTLDVIREHIGAPKIIWNSGEWNRRIMSPVTLECQVDGWSCGIFVGMAIKAVADGGSDVDWDVVADSRKDDMRKSMFEAISSLPVIQRTSKSKAVPAVLTSKADGIPEARSGEDSFVEDTNMSVEEETSIVTLSTSLATLADDAGSTSMSSADRTSPDVFLEDVTEDSSRPTKRKREDDDDDEVLDSAAESDSDSEKKPKRNRLATDQPKAKRGKRLSKTERRDVLIADVYCLSVEASQICCRGCRKWIQLNPTRSYDAKNWLAHRGKCTQITGKDVKRVGLVSKKPVARPKGVPVISGFFSGQPKQPLHNVSSSSSTPIDPEWKPKYRMQATTTTKSIANIFSPRITASAPPTKKPPPPPPLSLPCIGLRGDEYREYILRTHTRSLGGVSLVLRARAIRQLTPWNNHPETTGVRETKDSRMVYATPVSRKIIPEGCPDEVEYRRWTSNEKKMLDEVLGAWARWVVNYVDGFVCSSTCQGRTTNANSICDACLDVAQDESFKRAVREKDEEAKKSVEDQQKIVAQRAKYARATMPGYDANKLNAQLADPLLFDAFMELKHGEDLNCFLKLYKYSASGKLKDKQVFLELCKVMAQQAKRHSSDNPNLKFGMRYPANFLNFMILVRSYGHNSARQYDLISKELCGPSPRHLRSLVSNHEDALKNPNLIFENVARVKRFMDSIKYTGPVAVAGDCTKVRPRLTYSNDFGSHILGSTLPLEECKIDDEDDIDDVISKIKKKKAVASQVRAILIKIPLPQHPPMVVSLIPTTGKDDAEGIHALQLKLLKMAANLNMQIVSFAADGASAELAAQGLLDNYKDRTLLPPVTYTNVKYGLSLKAPVFPTTGPVVSLSDAPHGKKTCKNQNTYGTHTASLGISFITFRLLIMLYLTGCAGLKKKDIEDSDKQDDGAARRLFYFLVFLAMSEEIPDSGGELRIQEEFTGLFVYLWVFGTLFDAWMSRTMSIQDRLLAAFRARFWLHLWRKHTVNLSAQFPDLYSPARCFISPASFHIFNRLCDTLILLAIIYSRYYPNQPFCPWLHGTEFVEHFFGLARMLLPNFTYTEFLKMCQHMEVRQRILLSEKFNLKRERDSAAGYIMDYDAKAFSVDDQRIAAGRVNDADLDALAALAYQEAAQICKEILLIPASSPTVDKPLQLEESDLDDDSDVDEEIDDDSDAGDVEEEDANASASLSEITSAATLNTARYSALCEDLETVSTEFKQSLAAEAVVIVAEAKATVSHPDLQLPGMLRSMILDDRGKISIKLMVDYKKALQAGTTTHSEHVVSLKPKFALAQVAREADAEGKVPAMSIKEASHRVRIAQDDGNNKT